MSAQNSLLTEQVSALLSENSFLKGQLLLFSPTPKKDSHNSSLPPSSDIAPTKKSLRTKSGKKSGGQKGHKGHTLELSDCPTTITVLKSAICSLCGSSLEAGLFYQQSRRQVVDIPPVVPVYTEFQQYACECPTCSHKEVAPYPPHVQAPIQYGSHVSALVSYMSVYQYLSYNRLQSFFTSVFGLPLSEGSIDTILGRTASKCQPFYEEIKTALRHSAVVGADETGAKIKGGKGWFWTWQNTANTYIVASDNRGEATVKTVWEDGLPETTLVSDRYAAQLGTPTLSHQLCLAHLLRDVIYLAEAEKHPFASQFKEFVLTVFDLHKQGIAYTPTDAEAIAIENKLEALLVLTIEGCPATKTFQKSMRKNRQYLLPCLYNNAIPPDNNASERAIRNIKVKQKVSGQFKTGQHVFAVIRSVIDTLRKRKIDFFKFLNDLFKAPTVAQAP